VLPNARCSANVQSRQHTPKVAYSLIIANHSVSKHEARPRPHAPLAPLTNVMSKIKRALILVALVLGCHFAAIMVTGSYLVFGPPDHFSRVTDDRVLGSLWHAAGHHGFLAPQTEVVPEADPALGAATTWTVAAPGRLPQREAHVRGVQSWCKPLLGLNMRMPSTHLGWGRKFGCEGRIRTSRVPMHLPPPPFWRTRYYEATRSRAGRAAIEYDDVAAVLAAPFRTEWQPDWGWVPRLRRWLRVVTLEDGKTVHNAFLDRRFKP
jgi:hypothetical protein